ncbi:AMED_5909 family protein [Amycolatopsis iheyensis]
MKVAGKGNWHDGRTHITQLSLVGDSVSGIECGKRKNASFPRTLREAHDNSWLRMPSRNAPVSVWVEFRRANVRMYKAVADIDRGHHHEALYWLNRERAEVDTLMAKPEWKSLYGREGVNPSDSAASAGAGESVSVTRPPDVPLGARIRALRAEREMTLMELAALSKVSKTTLIEIEAERRPVRLLDIVARLADAFDIERGELALMALRDFETNRGGWESDEESSSKSENGDRRGG